MASSSSSTSSTLSRYRPAVILVTGLAAVYGVYIIANHLRANPELTRSPTALRRSNAVHRRHRIRDVRGESSAANEQDGSTTRSAGDEYPSGEDDPWESEQQEWESIQLGMYGFTDSEGRLREIPLQLSTIPSLERLQAEFGLDPSQAEFHRNLIETQYLAAFSEAPIPEQYLSLPFETVRERIRHILLRGGISEVNIDANNRRSALGLVPDRSRDQRPNEEYRQRNGGAGGAEGDFPWRQVQRLTGSRGGQSLLNLLYHIAEDQARREGYVHRGVTCNSCGAMPIRGIRYRCANCNDFDLCETCETLQVHPKTHLFYKVRVPAPFLANPRHAQPVWYPGKPAGLPASLAIPLRKMLVDETGYENAEVDAMWDQFKCLAATEWYEDPNGLGMAIDRKTFDKCFSPAHASQLRSPQLIYDRIFAFYDVNGDGMIGFEEFVRGLASLNSKKKDERLRKIYQGYDIDGDGYVDRKDFLRMFRAYYALTKDLAEEMIIGLEDEDMEGMNARETIVGSQPISSIFATAIPPGRRSRPAQGKQRTAQGDLEIIDGEGVIRESQADTIERSVIIGEAAERSMPVQPAAGPQPTDTAAQANASALADASALTDVLGESVGQGSVQNGTASEASEDDSSGVENEDGGEDDGNVRTNGDGRGAGNPLADWPPSWVTLQDVEAILGVDRPPTANIRSRNTRHQIIAAAKKRLQEERRRMAEMVRQTALEERWRRRQFYVDEEEGEVAPEGYDDMEDETFLPTTDERGPHYGSGAASTTKTDSRPPSPRSRSSSKVRFQEHLTESMNETRSNPSTSSRSIPFAERWGGYELPEAEKDIGREILYQVTQQGLNEILDEIFLVKEDLAMDVLSTRGERRQWRHLYSSNLQEADALRSENDKIESRPELSVPVINGDNHGARALQSPDGDMPSPVINSASLPHTDESALDTASTSTPPSLDQAFLDNIQLTTADVQTLTHTIVDPWTGIPMTDHNHQPDQVTNIPAYIASLHTSLSDPPLTKEHFDPTLPQHRPNGPLPESSSSSSLDSPAVGAAVAPPPSSAVPVWPARPLPYKPDQARLEFLKQLEDMEKEIKDRGGPGRIDFKEFSDIMRSDLGIELSFLESWVEMASF